MWFTCFILKHNNILKTCLYNDKQHILYKLYSKYLIFNTEETVYCKLKDDRHITYDVLRRGVHATIVVVEKQKVLHILSVRL